MLHHCACDPWPWDNSSLMAQNTSAAMFDIAAATPLVQAVKRRVLCTSPRYGSLTPENVTSPTALWPAGRLEAGSS